MRRINPIFLFLLSAFSLTGASLPSTKPEDVGLSSERLQRIHAMVLRHMDAGRYHRRRDAGGPQRPGRLRRRAGHHGRGDQEAHDARLPVSHGLDDQAGDWHRHHDDARRGQDPVGRSGLEIHSRIQGHEGRRDARKRARARAIRRSSIPCPPNARSPSRIC